MNLTVNNYDVKNRNFDINKNYNPQFKGALDGVLTSALRTLDTNEMANAVLIDVGAMVGPRTYYDAKNRNKDAGFETFFREISGTFINCLSAGLLALGISHLITNRIMPETKLRPDTWYSDDSIKVLNNAWQTSDGDTEKYVRNLFDNLTGQNGRDAKNFNDVNWEKVDWIDEKSWQYITWKDSKYGFVQDTMKSKEGVIKTLAQIIDDKNISDVDKKNVLRIMEARVTNALGANRDMNVDIRGAKWSDRLGVILRDAYDMGKDIFTNENVNVGSALKKVAKINKVKIFGAITGASVLGLTNQYINRKITEKRTGKKGFVGDVDYETRAKASPKLDNKNNDETIKKSKALWLKKILASAGMIAMVVGVMKVKSPKDFVRKLQFTGPVTSGNAIKTIYAANITGRFLAADNDTELRESVVRDYFGFLNWLVLGGFAAKGVANILDPKMEALFNVKKQGKGIKHWLSDVSLKTHSEIAANGKTFAKKNLWKLNVAHISGLAYSAVTLGYLLPMINDKMTKMRAKKNENTTKV